MGSPATARARHVNSGHGKNAADVQHLYDAAKAYVRGYIREFCTTSQARPESTWTDCGCGAGWTPGVTLDPFAGTFTTGCVAEFHGRDAIGIDIDSRNRDLWPMRKAEVFKSLNSNPRQGA